VAEYRPEAGAPALPRWEARGDAPWVSLHGQARRDADRAGQGTRGLVVRSWAATVGGQPVLAPVLAATRGRSGRGSLGAELRLPATVTALDAGDRVEMWLEVVVFPLGAERYYGPDSVFRSFLAAAANTWRPVHREAAGNRPVVIGPGGARTTEFPLQVKVGDEGPERFSLAGGVGHVPVRLTGLVRPDAVELHPVATGEPGPRTAWAGVPVSRQADYDEVTGRWSLTYTLPAVADGAVTYEVRPARREPAAVPVER
jgi:hypothetical protein